MSARLAIVADPACAELHATEGGEVRCFSPGDADGLTRYEPDVVVVLDPEAPAQGIAAPADPQPAAPLEPGAAPARAIVHWAAAPVEHAGDGRWIAPGGAGLWRRAPLPAADPLFELPPADGRLVLVCGAEERRRATALADLDGRGAAARAAPRLTLDDLRAAAVVLLLGTPGEPLPAAAPAALATGRPVVLPSAEPGFGLLPGIDHLAYDDDLLAAQWADAAASSPRAFAPLGILGRLAAERHRASTVYARLLTDLELAAATANPRSAAPPA